jgi:DNA-directed RNA polymerase beta subunit
MDRFHSKNEEYETPIYLSKQEDYMSDDDEFDFQNKYENTEENDKYAILNEDESLEIERMLVQQQKEQKEQKEQKQVDELDYSRYIQDHDHTMQTTENVHSTVSPAASTNVVMTKDEAYDKLIHAKHQLEQRMQDTVWKNCSMSTIQKNNMPTQSDVLEIANSCIEKSFIHQGIKTYNHLVRYELKHHTVNTSAIYLRLTPYTRAPTTGAAAAAAKRMKLNEDYKQMGDITSGTGAAEFKVPYKGRDLILRKYSKAMEEHARIIDTYTEKKQQRHANARKVAILDTQFVLRISFVNLERYRPTVPGSDNEPLLPHVAVLNQYNYESVLKVEYKREIIVKERDPVTNAWVLSTLVTIPKDSEMNKMVLGKLPVKEGSDMCNLTDPATGEMYPPEKLEKLGWDPSRPGGAYIQNGQRFLYVYPEANANDRVVLRQNKDTGALFVEYNGHTTPYWTCNSICVFYDRFSATRGYSRFSHAKYWDYFKIVQEERKKNAKNDGNTIPDMKTNSNAATAMDFGNEDDDQDPDHDHDNDNDQDNDEQDPDMNMSVPTGSSNTNAATSSTPLITNVTKTRRKKRGQKNAILPSKGFSLLENSEFLSAIRDKNMISAENTIRDPLKQLSLDTIKEEDIEDLDEHDHDNEEDNKTTPPVYTDVQLRMRASVREKLGIGLDEELEEEEYHEIRDEVDIDAIEDPDELDEELRRRIEREKKRLAISSESDKKVKEEKMKRLKERIQKKAILESYRGNYNLLQKSMNYTNDHQPILYIQVNVSESSKLPLPIIFRGLGVEDTSEMMKMIRMDDTDETFAIYKPILEHSLMYDEGITTQEQAWMRIGQLRVPVDEQNKIKPKDVQYKGKEYFQYKFLTMYHLNGIDKEKQRFRKKAEHVAYMVRVLVLGLIGEEKPVEHRSFENRILQTDCRALRYNYIEMLKLLKKELKKNIFTKLPEAFVNPLGEHVSNDLMTQALWQFKTKVDKVRQTAKGGAAGNTGGGVMIGASGAVESAGGGGGGGGAIVGANINNQLYTNISQGSVMKQRFVPTVTPRSEFSQLNRVSLVATMKYGNEKAKHVHESFPFFVDPEETTSSSDSAGLRRQLSLGVYVTPEYTQHDERLVHGLLHTLIAEEWILPVDVMYDSDAQLHHTDHNYTAAAAAKYTRIHFQGMFYGVCLEEHTPIVEHKILALKSLPGMSLPIRFMSVTWYRNNLQNELKIYIDGCRPVRPVFALGPNNQFMVPDYLATIWECRKYLIDCEDDSCKFTHAHYEQILMDLLNTGVIQYVDVSMVSESKVIPSIYKVIHGATEAIDITMMESELAHRYKVASRVVSQQESKSTMIDIDDDKAMKQVLDNVRMIDGEVRGRDIGSNSSSSNSIDIHPQGIQNVARYAEIHPCIVHSAIVSAIVFVDMSGGPRVLTVLNMIKTCAGTTWPSVMSLGTEPSRLTLVYPHKSIIHQPISELACRNQSQPYVTNLRRMEMSLDGFGIEDGVILNSDTIQSGAMSYTITRREQPFVTNAFANDASTAFRTTEDEKALLLNKSGGGGGAGGNTAGGNNYRGVVGLGIGKILQNKQMFASSAHNREIKMFDRTKWKGGERYLLDPTVRPSSSQFAIASLTRATSKPPAVMDATQAQLQMQTQTDKAQEIREMIQKRSLDNTLTPEIGSWLRAGDVRIQYMIYDGNKANTTGPIVTMKDTPRNGYCVSDMLFVNEKNTDKLLVYFVQTQTCSPEHGDKVTTLIASKGVIVKFFPSRLMPKTADGRTVDIIQPPNSIVTRKPISQYEQSTYMKLGSQNPDYKLVCNSTSVLTPASYSSDYTRFDKRQQFSTASHEVLRAINHAELGRHTYEQAQSIATDLCKILNNGVASTPQPYSVVFAFIRYICRTWSTVSKRRMIMKSIDTRFFILPDEYQNKNILVMKFTNELVEKLKEMYPRVKFAFIYEYLQKRLAKYQYQDIVNIGFKPVSKSWHVEAMRRSDGMTSEQLGQQTDNEAAKMNQQVYMPTTGDKVFMSTYVGFQDILLANKFSRDARKLRRDGSRDQVNRQPSKLNNQNGAIRISRMDKDMLVAAGLDANLKEIFFTNSDGLILCTCKKCSNHAYPLRTVTENGQENIIWKCTSCGTTEPKLLHKYPSCFTVQTIIQLCEMFNLKFAIGTDETDYIRDEEFHTDGVV